MGEGSPGYHFCVSSIPTPIRVLSFEGARHAVEQHAAQVPATDTETAELLAATGRVLAEPILADRDFPPFPRATRDGYAVRAADVTQVPTRLEVMGEIKAGDPPDPDRGGLRAGQAVSIMTGAALPPGADAVVMVEYTTQTASSVEIQRSAATGENFVPRAAEARAGQLLIEPGTRLDPSTVAIAASVGKGTLRVFRKPRIAVLSTGD